MLPSWDTLCSRQNLDCLHETHTVCLSKLSIGGASRLGLDHSAGSLRGTLLAGSQVVLKFGECSPVCFTSAAPPQGCTPPQDAMGTV